MGSPEMRGITRIRLEGVAQNFDGTMAVEASTQKWYHNLINKSITYMGSIRMRSRGLRTAPTIQPAFGDRFERRLCLELSVSGRGAVSFDLVLSRSAHGRATECVREIFLRDLRGEFPKDWK
jgi:hypothetical protein